MTDLFSLLRARRGWSDAFLDEVNSSTHPPLLDIDRLCDELHTLATSGELLVIYPDIDMDGITSGTLGYAGLRELGFNVRLHIPDASKGHGLRADDVDDILRDHPQTRAIITCDTGIDSFSGVNACKDAGVKIFVTDHHKEILRGNGERINADVVVDPVRIDDPYPHKGICGAHVLYQVLERYTERYRPDKEWEVSLLRLFAGIGTVTDVMPVLFENRAIVRDAVSITRLLYAPQDHTDWRDVKLAPIDACILVQILNAQGNHDPMFVRAFHGMAKFIRTLEEMKKLRSIDDVNESMFGFTVGPIFNAIRRMEMPLADAFAVFFADDPQPHIDTIIETNERRKAVTKEYAEAIKNSTQPFAPFIYIMDMPGGMTGLVANQLMKESSWPTVVLRRNGERLTGSGRSPVWYELNTSLNNAGFWAAGHEHSFGTGVDSTDELQRMYDHLSVDAAKVREEIERSGVSTEDRADLTIGISQTCDTTLEDQEALLVLAEQIEMLAPYGHEFTRPELDIVIDASTMRYETMGSEQQHLRVTSEEGFIMLWWNKADMIEELDERADAATGSDDLKTRLITFRGSLGINTFRGVSSANLIISSMS